MGKGKKSKNMGRKNRRPGVQGQQQTEGTAARNPQAPNNQKKRAIDGEMDDLIASKYIKTNTQPQQRVPAPKPAPNQTKHLEFDALEMEQDSEGGSEKADVILEMPEEVEGDDDSAPFKQAEETKKEDKMSVLLSDLEDVEATVRKLQRQVKNFKKKLANFNEDRED
ncbi:hypothetical protein F4809DRAFT_593085 [Biscogniauxia mediterranea]|nr:hypothetical protein F4809DRAFT_593085 [Biscogniauxia mediterranea]